jgi:hypothetical protein
MRIPFWRTRAARLAALALLAAAATGSTCKGEWRISTGAFASDGASFDGRAADLVGTWRRLALFTDASGATHSQESTWSFASDGGAALTVVARNLSAGLSETTVRRARWRTEGGEVVIDYADPDDGTVRLTWSLDRSAGGTRLFLDTLAYDRVTS